MEAKKRGRKPKDKTVEAEKINLNIVDDTVESVEVVQKKRGRKPKPKDPLELTTPIKKTPIDKKESTIIINKFIDNSAENKDNTKENLSNIVHLSINEDSIDNLLSNGFNNAYDNGVPNWYSKLDNNPNEHTGQLENNVENNKDMLKSILETRQNDMVSFHHNNITNTEIRKPVDYSMYQFRECNKTKTWPTKTNILCFNCCHSFNHTPATLPVKYQNGIFYVYGCFCYPECAAGFNFSENIFLGNKHENYNLLNLLYKQLYNDPNYKVKIASHRTVLKMFGGNLDIITYRESFNNPHTQYNLVIPPMLSIIPIQEEHNVVYYKKNHQTTIHNNNKGYDGAYKSKDKDYVLKRSKPILNKINTLDNCMNIFSEMSSKSESLGF
jgi:hypothetical protein